jgi:hypothetical protein
MSTWRVLSAQIVADFDFQPLSLEEKLAYARQEIAYREQSHKQFNEYQDEAYRRYKKGDLYGFLTYSNYALQTGWYNNQLYYDRGCAYEQLNDFKNAKNEYKKALKHGYTYAESALRNLKIIEKAYKRGNK